MAASDEGHSTAGRSTEVPGKPVRSRAGTRYQPSLLGMRLNETKALALLPLLGFVLLYAYEAGRFIALDLPVTFIDLDTKRIIAGSLALAILGVTLATLIRLAIAYIRSDSRVTRGVGWFVLSFVLLGGVMLLGAQRWWHVAFALTVPLVAAFMNWNITVEPAAEASERDTRDMSDFLGEVFLIVLLAMLTAMFGYRIEAWSPKELCVAKMPGHFIAATYTDLFVMKPFSAADGSLLPGVELISASDAGPLTRCRVRVHAFELSY